MPQKVRDVNRALTSKGFRELSTKRDHIYLYFFRNGENTGVFTKYSHSASDISDSLCSQMAKQIKLSNQQFRELVDCTLSEGEYVKFMIDIGRFS